MLAIWRYARSMQKLTTAKGAAAQTISKRIQLLFGARSKSSTPAKMVLSGGIFEDFQDPLRVFCFVELTRKLLYGLLVSLGAANPVAQVSALESPTCR